MEKEEIVLPQMLSFDTLNKVLVGYLRAGGDKEAVNYKEAADRAGVRTSNVSRNNKFLSSAGFLQQEKRGYLRLTDLGAKYAQTLDWGREEDARECLKQVVRRSPSLMKIIDYVRINKEVPRNDLLTAIATMAHVPKEAKYITGINAIIDILVFSGLISEKDNKLRCVEKEAVLIRLPRESAEELIEFVIGTDHYAIEKRVLGDFIKNHGRRIHGEHYHL